MDDLDRCPVFFEAEPVPLQDLLITPGVQILESFGEFKRGIIDSEASVRPFPFGTDLMRQIIAPKREEPSYIGLFELKEASRAVGRLEVNDIRLRRAKDPGQHIEKMDPDIGGDAAGLGLVALPREKIPASASCDIGKVDLMPYLGSLEIDLLLECLDCRVKPELENGIGSSAGFPLYLGEGVDIPGIEDERLFAYGIGPDPQGEPDMGVMKVVR